MVNEVTNGDGLVVNGHFGNVVTDVVVEIEFALLCEEKDTGGSELFGGRGDVEDGVGGDRDIVFKVGHAVALLVDDGAVLNDGEHTAGGVVGVPLREEGVYLCHWVGHGFAFREIF